MKATFFLSVHMGLLCSGKPHFLHFWVLTLVEEILSKLLLEIMLSSSAGKDVWH